jgi:hypothetical protein
MRRHWIGRGTACPNEAERGGKRRWAWLIAVGLPAVLSAQRVEYGGPTILSRGGGVVMRGGGEVIRLRPYVHVMGFYDSGLTPFSLDPQGRVPEVNHYGAAVQFGVLGYRQWRRTVVGADYRGGYRHYPGRTYFNGTDHHLALGVVHQVSRRVVFSLREQAGLFSRSFGIPDAQGFLDPAFAPTPRNELFDAQTYYLSTLGDVTFQLGRNWSSNLGGTGFVVRRRHASLIGVAGWSARGDLARRIGRNHAIGFDYDYVHFGFTRLFGSADAHGASFDWAARLGRYWDFGLRVGALRLEMQGLRRVTLDPIVAAILGQTTGVEAFHRVTYVGRGDARLSRVFRRSRLGFYYSRGVHPGNGIFLTSGAENAGVDFSYTGLRKWHLGASAGYSRLGSFSEQLQRYVSYHAGVGAGYQMFRGAHLTMRVDARNFEIGGTTFRRTTYHASVGIAFSPGEIPLSLW